VTLGEFRGRVVAVNFLYTRCPLPDVCPRLAAHFAYVQRRFAAQMGTDLILLSVTLDPRHDTPERLLRYATIYSAKPEAWRFLTGSEEAVAAVAERFGMHFWAEEGMIVHTSETGIIGRDGRLAARVGGSGYRARELGDLIEEVLKQ
jgi:protein SCO1/2